MAFLARPVLITAILAGLSGTSIADDRSVCGSDKGRPDQIVAACRRALAASPADLQLIWRFANVLRVVRQYADCIDIYSKGIDILGNPDPSMWPVFYFRAICYDRNNQWEKAETDLRKALALKPDEPHVLNLLGYSLLERGGRVEDVLPMLRRAVEQLPDDGYAVDSLGWAYFRSGNYDEALRLLERAVQLKGDDAQLHDHLGDAYAKLGRQSEARSKWMRARSLNPEPKDLQKIEAKIAAAPAQDNATRDGNAAGDRTGPGLNACKPGAIAMTPDLKRANPQALQERFEALFNAANFTDALAVAQKLEALARARVGTKSVNYALALRDLALACATAYDAFEEANALFEAALAIVMQSPNGPNKQRQISDYLRELADNVFFRSGRFGDAAKIHKLSLSANERAYGPDNITVGADLGSLGLSYMWQGKYSEAEAAFQRALAISERASGAGSLNTAAALNNLAILYLRQGRYAEAQALLERSLLVYERQASPFELRSNLSNLAEAQAAQGRYAEAEVFLRRVQGIDEKSYGADSSAVGFDFMSLGIFREWQGRYSEAEAALRQASMLTEKSLGSGNIDVAKVMGHLGVVLRAQGKFGEAEPLLKQALAVREQVVGANHPDVAATLDDLAELYAQSGDDRNALAYSRRASAAVIARAASETGRLDMSNGVVDQRSGYFRRHVAHLAAAARKGLEPLPTLRAEALEMAQWAVQSTAASAVEQMALRFASGNSALAASVRQKQDLASVARTIDKLLVEALAKSAGERNQAAIEHIRAQVTDTEAKLADVSARLEKDFPDYAALANPKPLKLEELQKLLGTDEALVFILTGDKESEVFAINHDGVDWKTIPLGAAAMADKVAAFRRGLSVDAISRGLSRVDCDEAEKRGLARADCDAQITARRELFDLGRAYDLYQTLLAPVDAPIKDKRNLLIVSSGALTALPFHLLVTEKPALAKPQAEDEITAATFAPYRKASWLIKRQAVTVLPAATSLKALRVFTRKDEAAKPLIGFGDPVFNPDAEREAAGTRVADARGITTRSYTEFWRGVSIDRAELSKALPRLADTADELKKVASTLGAPSGDILLREAASETSVKRASLADYRIVYFATHGLVAGEVKGLAEPSLALSMPRQPSDLDDGLLTASEVAQLKLNADWVVLSACNTIAGDRPGAEALSGLARAFFYAGARALLVSHWAVDSAAATRLTTATFDYLKADPTLGRAEALRRAMLAYMNDASNPRNGYPAFWAPFEIVGEGAAQ